MTTKKEPIRELDDVKNAGVRRELDQICTEYRELSNTEKDAKDDKEGLKPQIKKLARKARVNARSPKLGGDGWVLIRAVNKRTTISKERLVEQGVTLEQIEEATVTTETPYFQVIARK